MLRQADRGLPVAQGVRGVRGQASEGGAMSIERALVILILVVAAVIVLGALADHV